MRWLLVFAVLLAHPARRFVERGMRRRVMVGGVGLRRAVMRWLLVFAALPAHAARRFVESAARGGALWSGELACGERA
jgi:hypothetical protein